jgi:excisionase family DNA binding protein
MFRKILEEKTGMVTVEELANLLSVSERHIYALVQGGQIPHLRIGTAVRFDPLVLCDWLERSEVVALDVSRDTVHGARRRIERAVRTELRPGRRRSPGA